MDVFKNTVFINLDERVDRREHFLQEFAKLGFPVGSNGRNPHRISATKLEKGAIGCSMSHIKALEYAKAQGWDQVCICEDDITFTRPVELLMSLAKIWQSPAINNAWDVLILGGNNWPPFTQRSDSCIQVHNCMSTTGYVVKRHYYDTLLQNYKDGVRLFLQNPDKGYLYAIDVWWRRLQVRDRWYMVVPATVDQWTNSYSNVENRATTYTPLMLDYRKEGMWLPPNKSWKMLQFSPQERAAVVSKEDKPWLGVVPLYKTVGKKRSMPPMQFTVK